MALETSAFFNSSNGDRVYQADVFARFFRDVLTNGILNGGDNLRVTATGTGMDVSINYGRANIQGYAYWNSDDSNGLLSLPLDIGGSSPRIDRIILRLDMSNERAINAVVLKGTAATAPTPPALTRTGAVYEISLAQVRVAAGKMVVEQSDITDERLNTSVCGIINSLISVDTSDMEEIFNAFMETIRDQSPVLHSEIIDDLTTADGTLALSANMGKTLNDKIQGILDGNTPVYAVYG